MSTASALAGVTAVLQNVLSSALKPHESALGLVGVSSLSPEQMAGKKNHLNLFLFQASENPALRNHWQPARDSIGQRLSPQPLALDLGYLLSAYSDKEMHAELMLGAGIQALHETPVFTRAMLAEAGAQLSAEQIVDPRLTGAIEQLKIVPWTLQAEDLSRIWSALQAPYRMTMAYRVSVVLIEPETPSRSPLPVLRRGETDQGPRVHLMGSSAYPLLETIGLPHKGRLAMEPGEDIQLNGRGLSGLAVKVVFQHTLLAVPLEIAETELTSFTDSQIALRLPDDAANWRPGTYRVHVAVQHSGETAFRPSGELPLQVAPRITTPPTVVITPTGTGVPLPRSVFFTNLKCAPRVDPDQRVTLLVGEHALEAQPRSSLTDIFSFGPTDLANGTYLYRLRVDGVESIFIDYSGTPPSFLDQTVEVG